MDIVYKNKNVESVCVDYRVAKRRYNSKIAEKLFAALELIRNAESIKDVALYPPFHFHALKGDWNGFFAIDLGRRLGYRLIVRPKRGGNYVTAAEVFSASAVEIILIQIEEVSNHYE